MKAGREGLPTAGALYRFQLLRYAPNVVSGEYYNLAVVLYDSAGRVVDARFGADLNRLLCHPGVEINYIEALRNEFEERRLLGEGFSEYFAEMTKHLSAALHLSERRAFFGADAAAEMDRLMRTYVESPPRTVETAERGPAPGTRRAVRRAMEESFAAHGLFTDRGGLEREPRVSYGGARMRFTFDFGYRPEERTNRYLHAIGLRNDVNDAARLCFVFERVRERGEGETALTAVLDERVSDDVRALLASSKIEAVGAAEVDELAYRIRRELGL